MQYNLSNQRPVSNRWRIVHHHWSFGSESARGVSIHFLTGIDGINSLISTPLTQARARGSHEVPFVYVTVHLNRCIVHTRVRSCVI